MATDEFLISEDDIDEAPSSPVAAVKAMSSPKKKGGDGFLVSEDDIEPETDSPAPIQPKPVQKEKKVDAEFILSEKDIGNDVEKYAQNMAKQMLAGFKDIADLTMSAPFELVGENLRAIRKGGIQPDYKLPRLLQRGVPGAIAKKIGFQEGEPTSASEEISRDIMGAKTLATGGSLGEAKQSMENEPPAGLVMAVDFLPLAIPLAKAGFGKAKNIARLIKISQAGKSSLLRSIKAVKKVGVPAVRSDLSKQTGLAEATPAEPGEMKVVQEMVKPAEQMSRKPGQPRERGFITTVKESPKTAPEVALRVNGEYIPRSTDILSQKARELIKKDLGEAQIVAAGNDDNAVATAMELVDYYQKLGDYKNAIALIEETAKTGTELGRAVQTFSGYNRLSPKGVLMYALKEGRKKNPNFELLAEDAKQILAMADDIENMPFGIERAMQTNKMINLVNSLAPSSFSERAVSVWKAGLLTGLSTSGINILSNTSNAIMTLASNPASVAADSVFSLFTKTRTKTLGAKGYGKGFMQSFKKAWRTMRTGFDERNAPEKFDFMKVSFGKSRFGKALQSYEESVFKMMGAQDQPFYYGMKSRSIYDQAAAMGKTKKLKGKELSAFVDNMVANPTDDMLRIAVNDAEVSVYQNKTMLGDIARAFQRSGGAFTQTIAPFTTTPAAVAMRTLDFTPVGPVLKIMKQLGAGKFNQRELAQSLGEAATGTGGAFAVGAWLMKKGKMTLQRPKSERERRQFELEGKRPQAIRVGDRWLSVAFLGPVGYTALLGGYYQQAYEESGSKTQAMLSAVLALPATLVDQTFLQGAKRVMDAMTDPGRFLPYYVGSLAGSVVPTIVANAARAEDQMQRSIQDVDPVQTVGNQILSRIPFARKVLPTKKDVFGNDVVRENNPVGIMADPTRSTPAMTSTLTEEMARMQKLGFRVTPTAEQNKIELLGKKILLSGKELNVLQEKVGMKLEESFNRALDDPRYRKIDDEGKKRMLENLQQNIKHVERIRYLKQAGKISESEFRELFRAFTTDQKILFTTGKAIPRFNFGG